MSDTNGIYVEVSAASSVFGVTELVTQILSHLIPEPEEPQSWRCGYFTMRGDSKFVKETRFARYTDLDDLISAMKVCGSWRNVILSHRQTREALFLSPCRTWWAADDANAPPLDNDTRRPTNFRINPLLGWLPDDKPRGLNRPIQFFTYSRRCGIDANRHGFLPWLQRATDADAWSKRSFVPSWAHMQLCSPPVQWVEIIAMEGKEFTTRGTEYMHLVFKPEPRRWHLRPNRDAAHGAELFENCPFGWGAHSCYESQDGVTMGMVVMALQRIFLAHPDVEFASAYLRFDLINQPTQWSAA